MDRAESNPLVRFERRTAARFEMKSGNSFRAGSAPDKRVEIELSLKDRFEFFFCQFQVLRRIRRH